MAGSASSATTGGARKHAWTKTDFWILQAVLVWEQLFLKELTWIWIVLQLLSKLSNALHCIEISIQKCFECMNI